MGTARWKEGTGHSRGREKEELRELSEQTRRPGWGCAWTRTRAESFGALEEMSPEPRNNEKPWDEREQSWEG